jgi:hypothetical protein
VNDEVRHQLGVRLQSCSVSGGHLREQRESLGTQLADNEQTLQCISYALQKVRHVAEMNDLVPQRSQIREDVL